MDRCEPVKKLKQLWQREGVTAYEGEGQDKKKYVVERVKANEVAMKDKLIKEVERYKKIVHNNLIKCFGYRIDGDFVQIVFENGDLTLEKYLKVYYANNLIPEVLVIKFTENLLLGIQCLHSQDIVHQDIHSANIILKDDIFKIIGLSPARILAPFTEIPPHAPPEFQKGKPNSKKFDVWSLGLVIYEMLMGKSLLKSSRLQTIQELHQKLRNKSLIISTPSRHENWAIFIRWMLDDNAQQRPSIDTVYGKFCAMKKQMSSTNNDQNLLLGILGRNKSPLNFSNSEVPQYDIPVIGDQIIKNELVTKQKESADNPMFGKKPNLPPFRLAPPSENTITEQDLDAIKKQDLDAIKKEADFQFSKVKDFITDIIINAEFPDKSGKQTDKALLYILCALSCFGARRQYKRFFGQIEEGKMRIGDRDIQFNREEKKAKVREAVKSKLSAFQIELEKYKVQQYLAKLKQYQENREKEIRLAPYKEIYKELKKVSLEGEVREGLAPEIKILRQLVSQVPLSQFKEENYVRQYILIRTVAWQEKFLPDYSGRDARDVIQHTKKIKNQPLEQLRKMISQGGEV